MTGASIAVFDASPIIALAEIHELGLARDLFSRVIVPPTVARECRRALDPVPPWIEIRVPIAPAPECPGAVDEGESDALRLMLDLPDSILVTDDNAARRCAIHLDLAICGSAGLLVRAKAASLIPAARPLLDKLRATRLFMTDAVYLAALEQAGESEA